jgi:hypothetical protein
MTKCWMSLALFLLLAAAGASRAVDIGKLASCPGPAQGQVETQNGMFRTHLVCDRILLEIPPALLDRDLLLNTEFVALSTGTDYAAPGALVYNRVVRFVRVRSKVHLVSLRFDVSARDAPSLKQAVKAAQLPQVLMSFDILADGQSAAPSFDIPASGQGVAPIIDLTPLFVSDAPEGIGIGFKKYFGMHTIDPRRSYIDRVKVFPNNVRVYYYQTWNADPKKVMETLLPEQPSLDTSAGFLFAANFLLLPERPMRPRYWDARVGYYSRDFQEYGPAQTGGVTRGFIERYRMEKKDRSAAVSEPVTPIVFYIGREVPDQWRAYLKRAVEDWQPAFEQAGFRGAILARDAPSEAQDPAWDPDDVRFNVIRWAPSTRQNALGSVNVDPRSGEVISSHTLVWHDVLKILETWYFVQVSPIDRRAQKLPLPADLVGELLRYVTRHEIGHTLGLRHNFKAAAMITTQQLRDPAFTRKWGTAASLLGYARFNYVAQPGDDVGLLPQLGPYDFFALDWGYRDFGEGVTPQGEFPLLDRMAARQVNDPWLRFGGEDEAAQVDPTVSRNVLAGDAIEGANLGLRNIDRVMGFIVPATSGLGADYERLREVYEALILQRHRELVHVARMVGGVVETRYQAQRGGLPFTPVAPAEQRRAVRFLLERAFPTPTALLAPEVLRRIVPAGGTVPLQGSNLELLRQLIDPGVFERMTEAAGANGTYLPTELLADLNDGLFSELHEKDPGVGPYRRELQRNYVGVLLAPDQPPAISGAARLADALLDAVATAPARTGFTSELADLGLQHRATRKPPSEFYAATRKGVAHLRDKIGAALPKVRDEATRTHLQALDAQLRAWGNATPAHIPREHGHPAGRTETPVQ